MFRYALKSIRANLTRLIATALAVVIGIGFLAAGLMLTDAMRDGLTGTVDQQYANVDLAVSSDISSDMGFVQAIAVADLDAIRGVDGVAAASGEVAANVRVKRDDGTSANLRSQGRNWIEDDELNPLTLVDGNAPEGDDQVVLDRKLLEESGAAVGDEVTIDTPMGPIQAEIVGVSTFGDSDAIDDGGTVSFSDEAAVTILAGGKGYQEILIRTDGDPSAVADRVREAVPGSLTVQTGAEYVQASTEALAGFIDFLRPVLQGFAYLALFVAAFVIFNTFSVVVIQRFRELALIRAVGGLPSQVRRSLIAEGFVIGVVSSAIGIVAGALIALLVQWVLARFDIVLPGSGVKITFGTILLCMIAGSLITVLSVIVPAFRAGRTKPVEAMRSTAVDTSGTSKVRAVFGGIFLIAAIFFVVLNQTVGPQWYLLAPAALFLFIGVFIGGPLLARLFAKAIAPVMGLFGLTGRLAADNSIRNPRRTATTANALVIGLFLVTLVTVSGEAMKTSIVTELNKLSSSDYIVFSEGAIPDRLVEDIADTEGVSASAPIRTSATVNLATGELYAVSTGDFDDLEQTAGIKVADGDISTVVEGDGMAVADINGAFGADSAGTAAQGPNGEMLGNIVTLRALDGTETDITVDAMLDAKLDSLFLGSLVSDANFEKLVGDQPVNMVFVRVDPGDANAVGGRLEQVLEDYTGVEVQPGNFIGQIFSTVFDFLIGAVNGLLGMSVVVALVGIVNTMTLSIFERRRELGMVRALGMTRQQVGRMVRLEAVLIGLLGTLIGMGSGILLSWLLISSLDVGIGLSFNWLRVGLIFAVGIGVGVVASLLPAHRATRLDMLEAMKET